ncbi:cell division protein DivIVA [Corynebacterium cystitidis]|uniref:cell division protein DivIVA n=1 Tax=Corynebacterium cystitidis TaxID=35757 RepID=UPI00211DDB17|nr:cell division protein DivIVA [Corynebacterium cystitidis]
MLSWILLIIVVLALIVVGTSAFGRIFGRGELLPPMEESQSVIANNRQAVCDGRIDDVELEVVPRGYRQDQVDALIEMLMDQRVTSTDERFTPKIDKNG